VKRTWPDLALRARSAERRRTPSSPPREGLPLDTLKFGDVLVTLLGKVVEETVGESREMTEDGFVAHLKDCVSCRRNVATFARMGVKIPSRILVAAGVEVLN